MGRYVLTTFTLLLFALAGTSACKPKKKCSSCNPSVDGVPRGSQDDSSPFSDIGGGASPIGHSGPGKGKGPSGGSGTPPSGSSGTPPSGSSGTPESPIAAAARTAVPDPSRVPPTDIPTATITPTPTPAPFKACEPAALVPTAAPTPVTPPPVPAPPPPTPTFVGDGLLAEIRANKVLSEVTLQDLLRPTSAVPALRRLEVKKILHTPPRPPHQYLFCALEGGNSDQFKLLLSAGMSACEGDALTRTPPYNLSAADYLCRDTVPDGKLLKEYLENETNEACRAKVLGAPLRDSPVSCLTSLYVNYIRDPVTVDAVKKFRTLLQKIPETFSPESQGLLVDRRSIAIFDEVARFVAANKGDVDKPDKPAATEMKLLLQDIAKRSFEHRGTFLRDTAVTDPIVRGWINDVLPLAPTPPPAR